MPGCNENTVRLGFIPLIDAAIPIVAHELGFAAAEGLNLALSREASWAAVRDKVAFGLLDCAHMLAGMPIAANLGIGQVKAAMIAPFALGLGGNAVTVSNELYEAMRAADPAAL
ncbi:MAG TPA: ABC transporter substrate-binding protein, partial [Terricaulis sp.]|nr:ABC transporter substrate-binding protein [Terricaulis sp.]